MQINSITILLAAFILDFIIKISPNFDNKSQNNNNNYQPKNYKRKTIKIQSNS